MQAIWGWKPELSRPYRKRFSLGGGQEKKNGEGNSPTPGSQCAGGPRSLRGMRAAFLLLPNTPARPQSSSTGMRRTFSSSTQEIELIEKGCNRYQAGEARLCPEIVRGVTQAGRQRGPGLLSEAAVRNTQISKDPTKRLFR